jgi:pimeloyl-ACP methyl ester carboxylesterase
MLLDHPLISSRIFHPRPGGHDPTLAVDVGDAVLGCYLQTPHPDAGLILHFHGNGELAAEYDSLGYGKFFTDMGVNVCFAEYRGYGRSTGEPRLAAMRADGEAILRATGFPPERAVAFGRSTGSLYAVELASRAPTLAGVILDSGIADIDEQWGLTSRLPLDTAAVAAELTAEFDQRRKLAGYPGPALVLHAANDHLVPVSHAERLHAWASGPGKRLAVYPDGNHNSILMANLAAYTRDVAAFLNRAGVASPSPE